MKYGLVAVCVLVGCGGDDVVGPPVTTIDGLHSTLTVDHATAVANGIAAVRATVAVVDTDGSPVGGAIVEITAGNASVAPLPATDVSGVTGADVTSTVAGPIMLSATARLDGGEAVAVASPVTVMFQHGPADHLRFATQPGEAIAGVDFTPAPQVVIEDANGNLVDDAAGTVTVGLLSNPQQAGLAGTTQLELVAGAATFDDVAVFQVGQAYRLGAVSALVAAVASSDPFDVVLGEVSPAKSTLTLAPTTTVADGAGTIAATVFLRNAGGVAVPGQPIAMALDGMGGEAFPASGTSDFSGRFDTVLTSVVAGDKLVTATSGTVTLTALATFAPEAACRIHLPNLPDVPQAHEVRGVAIADFDEDGIRDFATTSNTTVSILRHRGQGRVRAPHQVLFATQIGGIDTADFDGDGHADLVVAKSGPELAVLRGLGDAQFAAPTTIPLAELAGGVVAVDLDGDGDLDILARTDNTVVVVANLGTTFAAPVALPLGSNLSQSGTVAAADIDHDGRLDLVTVGTDGHLVVLLATPAGSFASPRTTNIGDARGPFAVADYDGDGKLDVVVVGSGGVYLARGRGDGTFTVGASLHFGGGVTVRAMDLDRDGRPDIVLASNGIEWLRGRGDGTFDPAVAYATSGFSEGLAVADLDGDGLLDLALGETLGDHTGVLGFLRGTGAGLDGEPLVPPLVGPARALFTPVTGDFDGNGTLDFVAINDVTEEVGVQLTSPAGVPTAKPTRLVIASPAAAGDFDGDGKLDLVVYTNGAVQTLRGDGAGGLAIPGGGGVVGGGTVLRRAIAADFDGDHALDLALVTDTAVVVARGHGDGTFAFGVEIPVSVPEDLAVADLDGDGALDLVISNPTSFSVVRGLGDGTFAPPATTTLARGASSVTVGRFHGGVLDLAVASRNDPFASVFAGNGDGTFGPEVRFATGTPPFGLRAGDLDGDGRADLVALVSGGVATLRGRGDGTFEPPVHAGLGAPSNALVIADFDHDGRDDVFAPSFDVGYALLHGRGCH